MTKKNTSTTTATQRLMIEGGADSCLLRAYVRGRVTWPSGVQQSSRRFARLHEFASVSGSYSAFFSQLAEFENLEGSAVHEPVK